MVCLRHFRSLKPPKKSKKIKIGSKSETSILSFLRYENLQKPMVFQWSFSLFHYVLEALRAYTKNVEKPLEKQWFFECAHRGFDDVPPKSRRQRHVGSVRKPSKTNGFSTFLHAKSLQNQWFFNGF